MGTICSLSGWYFRAQARDEMMGLSFLVHDFLFAPEHFVITCLVMHLSQRATSALSNRLRYSLIRLDETNKRSV